jgi:ankyrin repeat protein
VHALANNNSSGLHFAIFKGHGVQVLPLLVEKGIDINLPGNGGATPLHFACQAKDEGTVKLLLQLGAKPNLQSNVGNTPLGIACQKKSVEIVDILLRVEGIKLLVSEQEEHWNRSLRVAMRFLGLNENELNDLKLGELKGAEKLELYNILILEKLRKFVKEKKNKK